MHASKIRAAVHVFRLIIPATFCYGRAFIYRARIVNRRTLWGEARKGGAVCIYISVWYIFTTGLNEITALSYIILRGEYVDNISNSIFYFSERNINAVRGRRPLKFQPRNSH